MHNISASYAVHPVLHNKLEKKVLIIFDTVITPNFMSCDKHSAYAHT